MSRFFLHLWNSLHSLMLIISPGVELPCHRGSSKKPFLETWYKWEEHAKKPRVAKNPTSVKPWSVEGQLRILKPHNRDVPCKNWIHCLSYAVSSCILLGENFVSRLVLGIRILLGEKVRLSCNRSLFCSAHTLDAGHDLQRCISRLKSLLPRFRLFTLLENWTLENFLEGSSVQQVLDLKKVL